MSTVPTAKAQVRVHIRWMIRRDMPEVLAIEHASYEFPWCEEEFLRVLRQRNCIGMVAECGERVVGFMIYELHKTRLQVLNLAVSPEFRRMGVGRQMVAKLVGKLSSHRRTRISMTIRETNLSGQLYFRALDFRATEVLREYYEDTGEDAYVLQYVLPTLSSAESADGTPVNRIARQLEG
ncbi:ribosomal protein S18-alanine N-acetyltransferase [Tautonia sociabilis]|uniref:Ribosomal-protein-alanine N-acetyltransferase n=1 Tax=Tautonia sociabilis TaxID=2080755 RepID=A0A432MQL2_9BACT|nr:ribosomal protein S18-alanine N-acetyltransferase [Tautonia sociabilis]RUL89732.1 ribosomal-protein-alanine N-acetyltransferase [Tautonia sociabilis]